MAIDAAVLRAKVEIDGVQQAQAQLRGFGQQLNTVGGQSKTAAGGINAADASIAKAGTNARAATGRFGGLGTALGAVNPAALAAAAGIGSAGLAIQQTVGAAIQWESSLAGVAKTLDTTGLSAAQAEVAVAQIGTEIRQMALDIPIAATELAGVAEAAGQLGIARQDVVSFTETMAKLGVATDLTAEQAATSIARIANITGLATEDIDNFGSALVDLGNNSAATESEILAMATRIAAAGEISGLTEGEILGLSAALTSVGINAEAGGTAITQVMNEIETSVESADDRLATFAQIAGMSAEAFAESWRTSPNEAIIAFVEGLGNVTEAGGSTVQILDELGLDGIRVSQALNSAAGAGDLMRESMERGNTAMEENVALSREAEQRFKTTASQIQLFKNAANELGIALGTIVLPALVDITSELSDFASGMADVITVMTADPTMTDVVDEWDEQLTRFGELPNRIPDPPEEKGARWGSFFSDLAGVEWNDLWEGMFPDEDRFAGFENVQLPDVTDEQISKLQNLVDLYENTPARVRTVSQAEFERAQIMLEQIELFRLYNNATADQRAGLEQIIDTVGGTVRAIAGLNTEVESGALDYKFLEENTFSYQQAAEGMGDTVSDLNDIFRANGDVAADMVGDIVLAVTSGKATFEEAVGVFAGVPEDVLFPALESLEEELQGKLAAALIEGTNSGPARAQLEQIQAIMAAVGFTVEEVAGKFGTFGDVQDIFQKNIDLASEGVSEWQGHLSGAEEALGFLQEKIDAGIPLTETQQEQYDILTDASARYRGGIEDESEALIDAEVAKAQFIKVQDELNAALESGEITQAEYNDAIGAAAAELDPATSASMGLADAQGALQESIDGTVEKLVRLMVELGILDETEAEAILGVDIEEAESNVTHMEGRLQTYEETTAIARADVDDSGAVARIDGVEGELTAYAGAVWTTTVDADTAAANSAVNALIARIQQGVALPIFPHISEGFTAFAAGGPVTETGVALVGERGPEYVVLPKGAEVIANPQTEALMRMMASGTPFLGGFQEGTGGGGGTSSGDSIAGFDWSGLFAGLEAAAEHFSAEALDHIKNFVDAANSALDALGGSLDFATASAEFQASGVGLPGDEFLHHLSTFTSAVTFEMGEVAAQFETEFLDHVSAYADAAGAGMDLLGSGIDVLTGLEADAIDLEAGKEAATEVKFISEKLVKDLGDSAAKFASQEEDGFIGAAQIFAESAASGIDLLHAGINALEGLGPNAINLNAGKEAATEIKFITEHLVKSIGDTAAKFAAQEDEGFLGAAKLFAESALPAMELLATALDAISTLTEMGGEFNLGDAKEAATEVKFVVEHLVKSIGDAAAALALNEPEDFLTATQDFAEAAGPALDLMGNTLDLMSDLAETELDGAFARDFALLFQQLATTSRMAAEAVERAADSWATEVNPAIETFAEEAGISLGLVGDALSFVTDLRDTDMEGLFAQDFALVTQQLTTVARMVAQAVQRAAADWPLEVNPAIEAFADEAGASLGLIGDSLSFVTDLRDIETEGLFAQDFSLLSQQLSDVARMVAEAVGRAAADWPNEVNPAIEAFTEEAGASLALIGDAANAVEAILKLGQDDDDDDEPVDVDALAAGLVEMAETVTGAVEQAAEEFETDGLEATEAFANAAGAALNMMSDATDAFQGMAEMSELGPEHMEVFLANYEVAIATVEQIAELLEDEGIDNADRVLEAAQSIADILGAANDAIESISPPSVGGGSSGSGSGGVGVITSAGGGGRGGGSSFSGGGLTGVSGSGGFGGFSSGGGFSHGSSQGTPQLFGSLFDAANISTSAAQTPTFVSGLTGGSVGVPHHETSGGSFVGHAAQSAVPPGARPLDEIDTTFFGHEMELLNFFDSYFNVGDNEVGYLVGEEFMKTSYHPNGAPHIHIARWFEEFGDGGVFLINPPGDANAYAGTLDHALDFLAPPRSMGFSRTDVPDTGLPTSGMRIASSFADGGVTLGPSLAILGDNESGREMVLPFERNREFAQAIASALSPLLGQRNGDIILQVDGETLGRITSGHVNNMARSHVSQSGIPVGLGRR